MSKLFAATLLASAVLLPCTASAQDFYAGISTSGKGRLTFTNPVDGKSVSKNTSALFDIYGGYNFTDTLALEGGYQMGGKATFGKADVGSPGDVSFKENHFYLAGRLTQHLNEQWSLFEKAGVARTRFTGTGGGETDHISSTKPLLGVGVAYNITPAAAVTFELEHIGAMKKEGISIKQDRFQLGLKIGF